MKKTSGARQALTLSALLTAALFLLPLVSIVPVRQALFQRQSPVDETPPPPFESGAADSGRLLRVLDGETVLEMDLGTYLLGVLRAEMPASFPEEALKAQAVAARTYTCYQLQTGSRHETADICTDHTCCQAYLGEEQARQNWGNEANAYEEKLRTAVTQTDGEVMLYDSAPILAVFHSASAGLTRPAGEVWLKDLPYLQAVESPEKSDSIPNYYSRAEISAADLKAKFLAAYPEMDFSGGTDTWLTGAVTDGAGSVDTLRVGGQVIKGAQARSVLGLRSACFTWEVSGDTFIFYVTGYGHGVGLSQYGAASMAEDGADYREILTHYYHGVEIQNMGT